MSATQELNAGVGRIGPIGRIADAKKLRIRVDLSQAGRARTSALASGGSPPPRRRLKAFTFSESPGVHVPYGHYAGVGRNGRPYDYWMLFYYEGGKRKPESRKKFADAKARARVIAARLRDGELQRGPISDYDRELLLQAKRSAVELGVSFLELVDAGKAAIARERAANFVSKDCPDVVLELMDLKRREGKCGVKWLRVLGDMLESWAAFYKGPMHLARASDLNGWLRGLKGGLLYRQHNRAAALQLFRHAKASNYLPRDWDLAAEFKLVDDPAPAPVKIRVWSPEQLVKLLACTLANMIPFTVLQSFAGIRHEELNPEECEVDKLPLDWADLDFEQRIISIADDTGKTGSRIVPMSPNLVEWLKPYARPSGRICTLSNTSNALWRAKVKAGLPTGANESRNVLRKSFISYRLALVKNIGQVAEESGNSPAKIKSNYRKPKPECEGKRWFGICPTTAEILQLRFSM